MKNYSDIAAANFGVRYSHFMLQYTLNRKLIVTSTHMNQQLILFSGLPGSGKSTLARRVAETLRVPLFTHEVAESILHAHGIHNGDAKTYPFMLAMAEEQLALGLSVIVEGIFPLAGFRSEARYIASEHEVAFQPVHCICSDEALWKQRWFRHQRRLPDGQPSPTWENIEQLRTVYEPWKDTNLLVVDAVNPLEDNIQFVTHQLKGAPVTTLA